MRLFGRELEYILELRCDTAVVANINREKQEEYCMTLIKVAKQVIKRTECYGAVVLGFSQIHGVEAT